MSHHPECAADEIFVGNTYSNPDDRLLHLRLMGVKSARFGRVAYDIDGAVLSSDYAPLIIKCGADYDRYNVIMEARFAAIRNGTKRRI